MAVPHRFPPGWVMCVASGCPRASRVKQSGSPFGELEMNPNKVVIRFEQVAEQIEGPVRRVLGFVKAKNMLQLFDAADLEANPRSAKVGDVTDAIIDSIRETPDTFPFKTKGVLVGASQYEQLQRSRWELQFINPSAEGVLDGGHNMLAVGIHILSFVIEDPKELKRIKTWPAFKDKWAEYRSAIEVLRKVEPAPDEEGPLDFLIPLELLVPADLNDSALVDDFNSSLLEICAARNNNVQLTDETKANKLGLYEELRKALPPEIAKRVEWKTNDGGSIKVRDVLALAWIPLSVIDLPSDENGAQLTPPLPQNIYRNKGQCAELFNSLMENDDVSKKGDGDYIRELKNSRVHSALLIAAALPQLYDKIYADFPVAYNDTEGRFGKISVVKLAQDMRTKPTSPFTEKPVKYSYPDGLIMPLVYGLKALMVKGDDGKVSWSEDAVKFLDEHLESIVKKYRVILEAFRFDPQKIGKNEGSYELVLDAFETELLKRKAQKR
jgi:hypothetical protein